MPLETLRSLGDTFDIAVRVRNRGFSTIPNGRLDISIPVRAPLQNGMAKYYIYVNDPLKTEPQGMGLVCGTEGINPDDLMYTGRKSKRKRFVCVCVCVCVCVRVRVRACEGVCGQC